MIVGFRSSSEAALVEGDQLFKASIQLRRVGRGFRDAMPDMVLQQRGFQSAQRGVDRGDGVEDFRTVAVLLDHPADPLDLPDDAVDPAGQGLALAAVSLH